MWISTLAGDLGLGLDGESEEWSGMREGSERPEGRGGVISLLPYGTGWERFVGGGWLVLRLD